MLFSGAWPAVVERRRGRRRWRGRRRGRRGRRRFRGRRRRGEPGGGDQHRPGAGLHEDHREPRGARVHGHTVRQAAGGPAPVPAPRAGGPVAGRAERHQAAEHVLPGAVRVFPRVRGRGDVEPQHQAVRGLSVPEHLDTAQTTHQAPFERGPSLPGNDGLARIVVIGTELFENQKVCENTRSNVLKQCFPTYFWFLRRLCGF